MRLSAAQKSRTFLDFSSFAAFFGIWRSAGAFFALNAMRAHFFRFFQHIFVK